MVETDLQGAPRGLAEIRPQEARPIDLCPAPTSLRSPRLRITPTPLPRPLANHPELGQRPAGVIVVAAAAPRRVLQPAKRATDGSQGWRHCETPGTRAPQRMKPRRGDPT